MKDVLIGVFSNHSWGQVKNWAETLHDSGFDGDKIAITYSTDEEVNKNLFKLGFTVRHKDTLSVGQQPNIVVQRFFDIWEETIEYDPDTHRLITTDVADVVFQNNPSEALEKLIGNDDIIVASGENLRYKNEPWSKNNMKLTYGDAALDSLWEKEINCAGVMAGGMRIMRNLIQDIWIDSQKFPSHILGGGGPDQAAYNVLLYNKYHDRTLFLGTNTPWAAQMGTTTYAVKACSGEIGRIYQQQTSLLSKERYLNNMKKLLIRPEVLINTSNGRVSTSMGQEFSIVHQYNRVPEILMKYTTVKALITPETFYYKVG